jgi:hypothetical protein
MTLFLNRSNFLILVVAILLLGCRKNNPIKDQFYIDKWTITGIKSGYGVESTLTPVEQLTYGEITFKGYRKKAKRGSYNYKFTDDGEVIEKEGDFVWWIFELISGGADVDLNFSTEVVDDLVLGIGAKNWGSVLVNVIDNNTIKFILTRPGTNPTKNYLFELQRK